MSIVSNSSVYYHVSVFSQVGSILIVFFLSSFFLLTLNKYLRLIALDLRLIACQAYRLFSVDDSFRFEAH